MAGTYTARADTMRHRDEDPGYRVAWKYKYRFEKGRFDEALTYGEAKRRAEQLAAEEPDKVFWPEVIMDPNFEH